MRTPWGPVGVRTSIVHRYGTVERFVEPRRVPSCQIGVPTETRRTPIWLDVTRRVSTDRLTVPYRCAIDILWTHMEPRRALACPDSVRGPNPINQP